MKLSPCQCPTTRVTPITEQQLWLTVCVKNWGRCLFHAGGFGNGSLDVSRKYTLTGSAQRALPRGVARGPCGKGP